MRFVLETDRLEGFLSKILISDEIDEVAVEFLPDAGAKVSDVSEGSIAVVGDFYKDYFTEWDVEEEDVITLSAVHKDNISYLSGREVEVTTENEELVFKSATKESIASHEKVSKNKYRIELFDTNEYENVKLPADEVDEGYIPENSDINIHFDTEANLLKNIGGNDRYDFEFKDEEWKITVEDVGSFTKRIPAVNVEKFEEMDFRISKDYFDSVVSNLSGRVTVMGNNDMLFFHDNSDEYTLSYVVAGME